MPAPSSVLSPQFVAALDAGRAPATRTLTVDGQPLTIAKPFASPGDWRDHWIYFLQVDRFYNPGAPPKHAWNQKFGRRQGGTLAGVRRRLKYLRDLGAGAIWISPVLRASSVELDYEYAGYATQHFLEVDPRIGTEQELIDLVDEAHARGMYVILDIVLNHAGRSFDYLVNGNVVDKVGYTYGPSEYTIRWRDAAGAARADWQDNLPPAAAPNAPGPTDAVWPAELQRADFFRRRGEGTGSDPLVGDFGDMRELVTEYDATVGPSQRPLLDLLGARPVLSVLIKIYQYAIAKFDIDGYRIDTVKHVAPDVAETFGNAMREFALSAGKRNFFTFGEIADDDDETIARYVGRNSTDTQSFGIDAALDFPLCKVLVPAALDGGPVEAVRQVFDGRIRRESALLSSHGEAGRFFVTFLDNHDRHGRFLRPGTPREQLLLALTAMYALQGIPCLYYGTEQGLTGTTDGLDTFESVREALWGKPNAFDAAAPVYQFIKSLTAARDALPPLRYGRLYFRPVSGDGGANFGQSFGKGGLIVFSRILSDREVLVACNTSYSTPFAGDVLVDASLHAPGSSLAIRLSSTGSTGAAPVVTRAGARIDGGGPADARAVTVTLAPMEAQILA